MFFLSAVVVYYCNYRGYPGAEGYENRPHPDNKNGDKFELCVKGIQKLKDILATKMNKCYLWLDFCCIDQESSACAELKMLKEIVECCDCLFTPIYDPSPDWELNMTFGGYYTDYKAKLWNEGDHAYLNRGIHLHIIFTIYPFISHLVGYE